MELIIELLLKYFVHLPLHCHASAWNAILWCGIYHKQTTLAETWSFQELIILFALSLLHTSNSNSFLCASIPLLLYFDSNRKQVTPKSLFKTTPSDYTCNSGWVLTIDKWRCIVRETPVLRNFVCFFLFSLS